MALDIKIFQLSSDQPVKQLDSVAAQDTESNSWLWVNIYGDYDLCDRYLKENFNLDTIIRKALTADETRPRAVVHDHGYFVTLRGVNLNPGRDPEDMLTVRFWVTDNLIISCHRQNAISVDKTIQSVSAGKKLRNPSSLFIAFCDNLTEVMSETISDISETLDSYEEQYEDKESSVYLAELSETRRQILLIRRYLAPQRDTLYHLQVDEQDLFTDKQQINLREINERITRYIEELDSDRDRSNIIMEQFNNKRSEQMNQRMLVLSIVAAIFLPLSFLTGLLGVNLGGIPGANSSFGFLVFVFSLVVIGVVLSIYFKRKNWI